MSRGIKSYRILLFIAASIGLLALVCVLMPTEGVKILGTTLRFPTLQKIMERKDEFDIDAFLSEEQKRQDSIAQRRQDSIAYYMAMLTDSATGFYLPEGDSTFFDNMFALMESAQDKGRTVRVLHYGDSQIEMDRMSDRLRDVLQAQFGGGGPGLLPLRSFTPVTSAQIWAQGSVQKISSFGDSTVSRSSGNYGPMMQCSRVTGGATSGIKPTVRKEASERLSCFDRVKVLFNNRGSAFSVQISASSMEYADGQSTDKPGVQCFEWIFDSCATKISFQYSGTADVYGLMVDNGSGVAVDNIPMRGCSGHQFKGVNEDLLRESYAQMDVALIIMQFGGNSLPYIRGQKALDHYCQELGEQIDYVRSCCPQATIVFIGPSDMTTTVNGSWQSYPFLPEYVEGLRNMALEHGAAYWSIYDAMGGWNSMKAWVDNGYAGKDYMHFTQRGANVMGDRLAEAFMKQYEFYCFRQRQEHVFEEEQQKQ